MRRKFIAGNWKMNKTISESKELANKIKTKLSGVENVDIAIFPPFTALSSVYEVLKGSNIDLGAQDVWYESNGAYTGEISPSFLVDVGCKYVIIGHSERRQYCNETNELVNRKLKASLGFGLKPIVCIGETLEQKENGKTNEVVASEFRGAFDGLASVTPITIAYEPIWAIGTGLVATPEIAEGVHKFIRNLVETKYGGSIANDFCILYGGSVKPDNIRGASLDAESFVEIVKFVSLLVC